MWRLMKIFYFWSDFRTNVYVKLFIKELNLFWWNKLLKVIIFWWNKKKVDEIFFPLIIATQENLNWFCGLGSFIFVWLFFAIV